MPVHLHAGMLVDGFELIGPLHEGGMRRCGACAIPAIPATCS